MGEVFLDLTIVLCLATFFALVLRFLKQPPILAYIITGLVLGPFSLIHIGQSDVLHSLSNIGIALLLFMLGLELRFSELKTVGKIALTAGAGQILLTGIAGFLASTLLGFPLVTSIYLAVGMTFSSTIIIVKLLSDKKDLNSLHGKIAVGMLLAQDFVAIMALILLAGFGSASGHVTLMDFAILMLKIVVIGGWTLVLSKAVFPIVIKHLAKNSELLFLFSLAWAFGMAAVVSSPFIGFSVEIGGFLAGLALANSIGNLQISVKVRSLRDFFITIFFVTLGMNMVFTNIGSVIIPAIVLSIFILIGNPIIVMAFLGLMGHRRRTSFLTGLTVAQISEFSIILIVLGNKLGQVSDRIVALVTLIAAITFVLSTYMILHGHKLYKIFFPYLGIFERKKKVEVEQEKVLKDHVILVGANRMGESILDSLIENNYDISVVDFDPDVVERLSKKGIACLYGDIADPEIQDQLHVDKARLIISTVPDVDDNLILLESLKKINRKAKKVMFAVESHEAKQLYDAGADYVVLPHLAGGRHLAKVVLEEKHLDLDSLRKNDLQYIL
jgi:Kef-type K+ transport system membrane component KefB